MADSFVIIGIAIIVLVADALVCCIEIMMTDSWGDYWDDHWFVLPLLTNVIGFAISVAYHIFNHKG